MKRKLFSLIALVLGLAMLGAVPAMAEERIEFSVGAFDLPATLESSDEMSVPGAAHYDGRWAYLLDKFGAKTEYVAYAYATNQEQMRQMVNGGSLPSTIISTLGAAETKTYAEEELVKLLPKGFEEQYPNIKRSLDLIPIRESYQLDGQYFCIPRALESVEPYIDYEMAIYFRKDLAREAGCEIKDVYSMDELYDMYSAVHGQYPEVTVFSSIWPKDIRDMGLFQAVPNTVSGKEWYKNADGEYVYAWAQPEIIGGIQNFKRFYDAGFLKKEFFNDADYEARDQFSAGQLFSYWDGLGMDFYNNVCSRFTSANPDANVEDAIACAWLKLDSGKLNINQTGNTWSEIVFSPEVSDEQLATILSMFDYLLSPEGIRLCNFGLEGKDYELDELGNVVDLREKDPESGVNVPFNADKEVPDYAPVVMTGALPDSSVLDVSPVIRQYCKDEYHRLMDLRKADGAASIVPFDNDIASFAGETFLNAGAGLKPVDAIYKIIFENRAEDVPAAWQKWLSDNQAAIDSISAEVNEALGAK